jgi:hypothetical protein
LTKPPSLTIIHYNIAPFVPLRRLEEKTFLLNAALERGIQHQEVIMNAQPTDKRTCIRFQIVDKDGQTHRFKAVDRFVGTIEHNLPILAYLEREPQAITREADRVLLNTRRDQLKAAFAEYSSHQRLLTKCEGSNFGLFTKKGVYCFFVGREVDGYYVNLEDGVNRGALILCRDEDGVAS